jgi:hypothetical protein
MAVGPHEILGRTVTMPVEVRTATAVTAMFSVPATATQRLVDYSGLQVLQHRPGRSVVGLVFVRYVDGDLGRYDEFGVAVLVRNHDTPAPASGLGNLRVLARGRAGVLIHRLPVDGEFTMAAGRTIWGFPKVLAEFDVDLTGSRRRVTVRPDGRLAVRLSVDGGVRVPAATTGTSLRAYTHLDGVTRFTDWEMRPHGVRARPGGVRVELGDHELAHELAGLGLPKRALFSTSMANVAMTFGDAQEV